MMRLIPRLLLVLLLASIAIGFAASTAWQSLYQGQPQVERADATPVVVAPIPTVPTNTAVPQNPSLADASGPTVAPTPAHAATISFDSSKPSPEPPMSAYSSFDFLKDYLTDESYPAIVDGIPWTNNSVNVQQYPQKLGGVTYWDFWSELENWDSPAFMYKGDDGQWHPYTRVSLKDPAGQDVSAYLLVDRQGPGVLDKIWFTQDAVWMLSTEESRRNVGPIADMNDFLEWGNLEALGNLRLEVDDQIAYDGPIKDWFSGKALGLSPELVDILTWRHRQYGSSGTLIPIPYQKHLRVLLYGGTKKPKWFMASGIRLPESFRVTPFAGSASDLPVDDMTRLAQNVLAPETFIDTLNPQSLGLQAAPGMPATIHFNGAGTIAALEFQVSKQDDPASLWLRVNYGSKVGIDLPLVAFFGDHTHLVLHRSTPIGIVESPDDYVFYCNLPLPFQNGATVELVNQGTRPIDVSVRVAGTRETTSDQLWVQYQPARKLAVYGPDYGVALPGDGKLVGLVLVSEDQGLDEIPKIVDPKTGVEDTYKRAWPMGYLEGNLSLADGAARSRIYGGHEDWADGGFYFNRGYTNPPGGSNRPFGGILRYKDGADGYATIFRYFDDLSAFRFQKGLQMNLGHGTWDNNFPVKFGITAYYYEEMK